MRSREPRDEQNALYYGAVLFSTVTCSSWQDTVALCVSAYTVGVCVCVCVSACVLACMCHVMARLSMRCHLFLVVDLLCFRLVCSCYGLRISLYC